MATTTNDRRRCSPRGRSVSGPIETRPQPVRRCVPHGRRCTRAPVQGVTPRIRPSPRALGRQRGGTALAEGACTRPHLQESYDASIGHRRADPSTRSPRLRCRGHDAPGRRGKRRSGADRGGAGNQGFARHLLSAGGKGFLHSGPSAGLPLRRDLASAEEAVTRNRTAGGSTAELWRPLEIVVRDISGAPCRSLLLGELSTSVASELVTQGTTFTGVVVHPPDASFLGRLSSQQAECPRGAGASTCV